MKVKALLLVQLLLSVAAVFFRRLLRGPLVEGWTWRLDIVVHFVLKLQRRYPGWDIGLVRALIGDAPPRPGTLDGMDIREIELGGVPGLSIVPPDAVPGRTFLHFHGGGYVIGTASGCREFLSFLSRGLKARVLTLDYRLAPEHPFPAAVDDALAAYRALLDEGQDPASLLVGGESAGGGLTFALALKLKEEGLPQPAGLFGFSPWVNVTSGAESFATHRETDVLDESSVRRVADLYAGEHDRRDPLVSPLFGDLEGLAPTFLLAGGAEIFLSDIEAFAARLQDAGVPCVLEVAPGMPHTWLYLGGIIDRTHEDTRALGKRLAAFLDENPPR